VTVVNDQYVGRYSPFADDGSLGYRTTEGIGAQSGRSVGAFFFVHFTTVCMKDGPFEVTVSELGSTTLHRNRPPTIVETIPIELVDRPTLATVARLRNPTAFGDALLIVVDAPNMATPKDAGTGELLTWEKHFRRFVMYKDRAGHSAASMVSVNLRFGPSGWIPTVGGGVELQS
jgi:hypothetical protein